MVQILNILVLDISGSDTLGKSVEAFFTDLPVSVKRITNVNLFNTLSKNRKKFAMAIGLVNAGNTHLVKGKYPIPTFVFQQHTYTHKKLSQFYRENGGGDG